MALPLRIASAVVCDDARIENTGKHLLIGVYLSNVLVREFPWRTQLTFWSEVDPLELGEFSAQLRVSNLDDGSVLMNGQINFKFGQLATTSIVIPKINLEFQKPGSFEFQWKFDGSEDWLAVKKFLVGKRPARTTASAS